MASFGDKMRKEREKRSISIEEISGATKISTRTLRALEDDRFDLLPGGIFNKSFVRAYARHLGLDEEKAVKEFLEASGEPPAEETLESLAAHAETVKRSQATVSGGSVLNSMTTVIILAVLIGIACGSLWYREHRREKQEARAAEQARERQLQEEQQRQAQQAAAIAQPTATPVDSSAQPSAMDATATQTSPPPETKTPSAPVEIEVSAKAKAWISVQSDGKQIAQLTLDPENPDMRDRTYTANERLQLVVGNPAGLDVTYNGKPAGPLGDAGRRAKVTFTPTGIEKQ